MAPGVAALLAPRVAGALPGSAAGGAELELLAAGLGLGVAVLVPRRLFAPCPELPEGVEPLGELAAVPEALESVVAEPAVLESVVAEPVLFEPVLVEPP